MVAVRRNTFIIGAVLLLIGFPIFAYAYVNPYTGTITDGTVTVARGTYNDIYTNVSKGSVRLVLNSTVPVTLIILDDMNAQRFKTGQPYNTLISFENVMSVQSGLPISNRDTYHFIISNINNMVNAYVRFTVLGTHTVTVYGVPVSLIDVAVALLVGGLATIIPATVVKESTPKTQRA